MSTPVTLRFANKRMRPKNLLLATLIAATLGSVAIPAAARTDIGIVLNFAPPPVHYERVPPPRVGFVWQPGYWDYVGGGYVWVQGFWVRARPGYYYHPHRWVEVDGRWRLRRGGWGRDADHDGIPNRRDRHPYNPHRR